MTTSNVSDTSIPLVFFFKGDCVPAYADLSLRDAVKKWTGPVVFLTNSTGFQAPRGVDVIDFSDFYRHERFDEFIEKSPLDPNFRDGFWFHTAERFFVLDQYARAYGLTKFVHLELDVILMRPSFEPSFIFREPGGLFYPAGSAGHAGASLFAVSDIDTLAAFVQFCIENAALGDEMALLWQFQNLNRSDVFELPSHSYFENRDNRQAQTRLSPHDTGGLFDIQSFGTWLLGQDPRNIPKSPRFNRFIFEGIGSPVLGRLSFAFNPFTGRLSVKQGPDQSHEILCLHIHSKNLALALNRYLFFAVVLLNKLPVRFPLGPQNLARYSLKLLKEKLDRAYSRVLPRLVIRHRAK